MFRRGLLRTLLNYFGTTTRVVPLFANIWPNNTRVHSGPLDAREECKAGQLEHWRLEDRMKVFDGDPYEVHKDRGRKEPVNVHHIIECFSPFSLTFEILFCLFRTRSFTRFTNDLDSTDNSNSASSFPMTNC